MLIKIIAADYFSVDRHKDGSTSISVEDVNGDAIEILIDKKFLLSLIEDLVGR